jgi:Protein of unknown function (DUF4231)
MVQEQKPPLDTRQRLRGRPHERTMERRAFAAWTKEFISKHAKDDPATHVWFERRFLDELDRRRGLESTWRKVFWFTRYVVFSGSLVLPVIITVGKSVTGLNIAAIVLSIIVALATAMEALLRSGRKWRLYRQGADQISSEGAAFFQELGVYAQCNPLKRLHIFKEHIEANIKDLHESYVEDIEVTASQNAISSSADRPQQTTG